MVRVILHHSPLSVPALSVFVMRGQVFQDEGFPVKTSMDAPGFPFCPGVELVG